MERLTMWNYPVVLHKDADSDYGVTVPDLPGCFSAGNTADEALAMAREAIELHLEGLIEHGRPIPPPGAIERHKARREHAGGAWALVSVDPENLRLRVRRLNITMPERMVQAVDRYAKRHGYTRSALLAQAVSEYIRRNEMPGSPPPRGSKPPKRRTRSGAR